MITDPQEQALLATIEQRDYRVANISRTAFEHIFEDFLDDVRFENSTFLDMGAGHFDFGEMARLRGANTHAVDYDPAIVALGRHKEFSVLEANLERVTKQDFPISFDGIFCKYACNAFTFINELEALYRRPQELKDMCKPDGWAWIAPWNGLTDTLAQEEPARVQRALDTQISAFVEAGFVAIELTKQDTAHYGIHGTTKNRPLFIWNLPVPKHLLHCKQYG